MERLDKYLSAAGLSRSQAKQALKAGRVTVCGLPEKDASRKIEPGKDLVALDGLPVRAGPERVVVMLNKPAGYVTSTEDPRDPTVMELIPGELRRLDLRPVGRLDKETEGLLLFTNDGELLHRLISPRHGTEKIYFARHEGTAGEADKEAFRQGLTLRDGTCCLPAELTPLGPGESRILLREGKYHQVRRMMASRGMRVLYLRRISEGGLSLGDLPLGQIRILERNEIETLISSENSGERR